MRWRIESVLNVPKFDESIKSYARNIALAEAVKQKVDLQDIEFNCANRLGKKWLSHLLNLEKKILDRYGEQIDDLLILASRINRYAHHYEAALLRRSLELSNKKPNELESELISANGCERFYDCGILAARHYTTIVGQESLLKDLNLTRFPGTDEILDALALDCALQASLCLPINIEKSLDFLADSMSAHMLALQGELHSRNYYNRKAERVTNGKAGAQKRHARMAELKNWTIQKYKLGSWRSANHAASELMNEVLEESQKIGANLMKSNAQRTIAEWIRKSV